MRSRKTKHDVWLLTDVLDPKRLPARTAARYYRWGWENEMVHPHYTSSDNLYRGWRAA